MEVVYPRCAGLDAHKDTVVACRMRREGDGRLTKETRTFGTVTADLLALADWLQQGEVTHVAMESTGIFWKPPYNVLAENFTVFVVNAAHIRAVPGHKTDVKDAEWIADLLAHGLLRPSFIPDRPQRELRDLTRTRTTLVDERAREVRRVQKVREDANLKLASVVTDVLGASGRATLTMLVEGTTDPTTLAELAKGRLRSKQAELGRALVGRISDHHRLLLAIHLTQIDTLDEAIERLSQEIAVRLRPFEAEIARLDTIPGVDRKTAEVLIAEIGTDMRRFPDPAHLASWAGMCPGNHLSAGRRQKGTTRKGSKWLRRALTEAAHGAARTKQTGRTALADFCRRLTVRHGKKKAALAVGHRILTLAYVVLERGEPHHEPSPSDWDERRRDRARERAIRQLKDLGYDVSVVPKQATA